MSKQEKILDDLAQLAGGAAGLASGISRQIRQDVRARIDEVIVKMDFVPRSDFERLEALYKELKTDHEALKRDMEDLKKGKQTKKGS